MHTLRQIARFLQARIFCMTSHIFNLSYSLLCVVLRYCILAYQRSFSLVLGRSCRFYPSCSNYALQILDFNKPFSALILGLYRIFLCNPLHPGGIHHPLLKLHLYVEFRPSSLVPQYWLIPYQNPVFLATILHSGHLQGSFYIIKSTYKVLSSMRYPNPNQNNNDNFGFGRILLVMALAIGFFALYTSLFPQPNTQETSKSHITQNADTIASPQAAKTSNPLKDNVSKPAQSLPLRDTLLISLGKPAFDDFEITIDALGRISQVYLKDEKFIHGEKESLFSIVGSVLGLQSSKKEHIDKLALFGDSALKTLEVRFSDVELNQRAFNTPYVLDSHSSQDGAQKLVLKQDLGEVQIQKTLTFYKDLSYELNFSLSNPNIEYFISNGMRPIGDSDTYAFRGVLLKTSDGTIEKIEDGDKQRQDFPQARFLASVDRYYTSLFYTPDSSFYVRLDYDYVGNPMPFVYVRGGDSYFKGYIGPKDYKTLESINPILTDVIEYGMITFFARPVFWLLSVLYDFCGNWGWAIVLLTLVVRILLFPLTYKGMISMQKLKDIAPKMKEIQTRYKGDPQKMQLHMMELYKKHGANPLGGCLPLLLQIPVFFAIYRVLYNAIELKNSEWIFWISDLSAIDPYFVLPILMGVSMYISQLLTPSNFTDPMQEKIFKMLPWVFMVFFIIFPFPAGLVLYWTINNVFSIIQQLLINSLLKSKKQ